MNERTAFEIERKYLIEIPDLKLLKSKSAHILDIVQTYLTANSERIRIRSLRENGNFQYIKTNKKTVTAVRRIETEGELTEAEYLALLNSDVPKRQLTKTRYVVPYKNREFEIDIYPFWKDKAIMEVELTDEGDEIDFPDFIKILREVTEEKEYRNFALAKPI